MKKQNKAYIVEYELMYPVILAVANKHVSIEALRKKYRYANGTELGDNILKGLAVTTRVVKKDTKEAVSLVVFNCIDKLDKRSKAAQIAALSTHEAIHVALDIYDRIGEQVCTEHQETFAYFVEYISSCIYETFTKK